jgi:hypothetical protein
MEINKDKKNKSFWLIKHLSIFIFFWGFIVLLLVGPDQFFSGYVVKDGIAEDSTFITTFLNYIIFYLILFYFSPKNYQNRTPKRTFLLLFFPILTLGYPIFEQTGNYNFNQLGEQFITGWIIWGCLLLLSPIFSLFKALNSIGNSYNNAGHNLNKSFNEKGGIYRWQYKAFQGNWVENNATSSKPNSLTIQHFLTMGLKLSNDIMRNHPAGWQPAARLIDPNGNVVEIMM